MMDSPSSFDDEAETRVESTRNLSQLREMFEKRQSDDVVVPKPDCSLRQATLDQDGAVAYRNDKSPASVASDGILYTNDDINSIASMLLNPHKVRGALQEKIAPSGGVELSKHVREALKVIVCRQDTSDPVFAFKFCSGV